MAGKIRVLVVEPMKAPRMKEIENTLESLRALVGGYIQALFPWEDPVCIICDDEGKLKGYPPNRVLDDGEGNAYDILVGTFLVCGLSEEDIAGLPEELAEKYERMFQYPDLFLSGRDGHVFQISMGSGQEPRMIC